MVSKAADTPGITILGSLNIDLVSYVPHHPQPGETLTANSFAVSPGGKGANQAVACAKLSQSRQHGSPASASNENEESAHVRMIGAVGTDTYGTLLRTNLSQHGVDTSGVAVQKDAKTGVAIIIVDEPTGQNRIVLSPEANHSLLPEHFSSPSSLLSSSASSFSAKPDLLILQLEIPLPTVLAALQLARDMHIPVLLNPAPAVPLPDDAYAGLAHLIVNESEAAVLGGISEADLETEEGLEAVASKFCKRGVQNVIVTLGGRGAYFYSPEKERRSAVRKGLVLAEKAKVVDTTAAGDTFVGAYALDVVGAGVGNGEGFEIESAVRRASKAAKKTVERMGAQDSIPWRDELST